MESKVHKVISVVGNRPQFVKQAMFDRALAELGADAPLESVTVNTGQHYDVLMSDVFFTELGAATAAYELKIGSGPILDQIGKMLSPLRQVIEIEMPDAVVLFGDTNSTLAGALAAAHCGLPCIHVEGGERLYRRIAVPEEINRIVSDHLADLVLTSSRKATRYLSREGFGPDRVAYVGDIMLDLFKAHISRVDELAKISPADYGLRSGGYMLATIHRVENTTEKLALLGLLSELDAAPMPVILPIHPRVKHMITSWSWKPTGNLILAEMLGYFDFLSLLRDTALVVSDSGGVTREALFAGKGCIVPLESCWWTEAVEAGLAITVGDDRAELANALRRFRPATDVAAHLVAREFGDGRSAGRIVQAIADMLNARNTDAQPEGPWHRLGYFNQVAAARENSGFTYDAFRSLVRGFLAAGYVFAPFKLPVDAMAPLCLMRHDIDFDLEKARNMARIEAEEGVSGTYFLMLTSDHYNLMSSGSRALIDEIRDLGHDIGLHFDETAYPDLTTLEDFQTAIAKEAEILSAITGAHVAVVSFHRPSALVLEGAPELSGTLLHSYDRRLKVLAEYAADSGGRWSHGAPFDRVAFAERRPMHILIHPVWWNEDPVSPIETLLSLLDRRRERDDLSFARNCRTFRVGHMDRKHTFDD